MPTIVYKPADQSLQTGEGHYVREGTTAYAPGVGSNFHPEPTASASHVTGRSITNARIWDDDAGDQDRGNSNAESFIEIDHLITGPTNSLSVTMNYLTQATCGWFGSMASEPFTVSGALVHAQQDLYIEIRPSGVQDFTRQVHTVLPYMSVGNPNTIIEAVSIEKLKQSNFTRSFAVSLSQGQVTIRVGVRSAQHAEYLNDTTMDASVKSDLSIYSVAVTS